MISLRTFTGEFPKISDQLLPEDAASYANNCDFGHGELRSLKAVALLQNLANNAQSLYTEDGVNFFSWASVVDAVKSPVISDQFLRVHYTTPTEHRVTQRTVATPGGGEPASSWKTGVVRPTSAPTVTVANRNALPDSATLEWKFFYEANGLKYQVTTITPSPVSADKIGREYEFTPPSLQLIIPGTDSELTNEGANDITVAVPSDLLTSTPENAIPCVEITGKDSTGNEIFHVFSANSSFAAGNESENFNGLTVALAASAGKINVKFSYGKDFQQTRAFVYTAVNIWDEESAPSDPVSVTYDIMQAATLSLPAIVHTGYVPISRYRVFGTLTAGTGQTDYQLVGEVASGGGATSFPVDKKVAEWGRLLDTVNYLPPPDGLVNLLSVGHGIEAARKGNEIWFCVPYKPWAWNPENVLPLPFATKAMIMNGASIVVTTTAIPYIINGTLPENMSEQKIEENQAGVSQRGIADCGSLGVFYVTNDGICNIRGGQATMGMSQRFFTREDWRARYGNFLSTMQLAFYDGALIGFCGGGSFMVRFDEGTGNMTQHNYLSASAGFMLPQTDSLYLAIANGLYQYGAGAALSKEWRSKKFVLATPANYGAMQVVCNGDITVELFVDRADDAGVITENLLIHTVNATGTGGKFRLPDGYMAVAIKVTVTGTGILKQLHLAPTMEALKRV